MPSLAALRRPPLDPGSTPGCSSHEKPKRVRWHMTRASVGFVGMRVVQRDGGGKNADVDVWEGKRVTYRESAAAGGNGVPSR